MTWTAESLSKLATGYWQSQALITAVKLGLFHTLPATAPDVAARLSANPRLTVMLLEALTAMGLLTRSPVDQGEQFHLHPSATDLLGPNAIRPIGPALLLNDAMYGLWSNLHHTVTTGLPAIPPSTHLGSDPAQTRRFVLGMHARALSLLQPVAAAIDLTQAQTLLDVGAGPATLTRMLCEKHPHLKATALDLPPITAVAKELTAAPPTAPRLTHLEASYLTDPLPQQFGAVLYCGALHQHSPSQLPAIFRKLLNSLSRNGTLYIVDLMLHNDRTGPDFSALFALNMALLSPTAHVHSPAEIAAALTSLGVKNIANQPIAGGIYHMVTVTA